MSAVSIRGRDWIFHAMWAVCNEKQTRCVLNIPLTFIFRQGLPFKCLRTNQSTGLVNRVILEDVELTRNSSERGFRGEDLKYLKVMRKMLIDFQNENNINSTQAIGDQDFICQVTYNDNEVEDLSIKTLDTLLRNETWRLQVLLIQGYIPRINAVKGHYSVEPQVQSKLITSDMEAANHYARSLAKYAEKAYVVSSSSLVPRSSSRSQASLADPILTGSEESTVMGLNANGTSQGDRITVREEKPLKVGLKVVSMTCNFVVDKKKSIYLLFCDQTIVEIDNGRREVEEYLAKEKSARELSAAQAIGNELQTLLQHASIRGLSLEASFAHFDLKGYGFIDTDLLIDGLARLGIGVTYPVGESLMQIIGGIGSNYITQIEFEKFLRAPDDIESFEKFRSPVRRGATNSTDSVGWTANPSSSMSIIGDNESESKQNRRGRVHHPSSESVPIQSSVKKQKRLQQLLPPIRSTHRSNEEKDDFMNISASQQFVVNDDSMMHQTDTTSHTVDLKKGKPAETIKEKELPLPLGMYTAALKSSTVESQDSQNSLPRWANARSHRALKEIRRAQQRADDMKVHSTVDQESSPSGLDLFQNAKAFDEMKTSQGKADSMAKTASESVMEPLTLSRLSNEISSSHPHSNLRSEDNDDDELLHLDRGVVMSYRLLSGTGYAVLNDKKAPQETNPSLHYRSLLEQREEHLIPSSKQEDTEPDRSSAPECRTESDHLPFLLVVVPDLFSTLSALHNQLKVLLLRYPLAKIVLVGLVGLPNTVWPKGWALNADLHSRSIAKLMQHLFTSKRILHGENDGQRLLDMPVFFMGIGLGAYSLTRFVTTYLPGLPKIEARNRAIILVNGLLKPSKRFKRVCKDIRNALMNSGVAELNELILNLLFGDEFLAANGRDRTLEQFWKHRRGLRMPYLLSYLPEQVNDSKQSRQSSEGMNFVGILEMLRGIIVSPDSYDGATVLSNFKTPVLAVQSTDDNFVDVRNASVYQDNQLPPNRHLVMDVSDSLDANAVHVAWMRAGHELLSEKTPQILGLLSSLSQLCGIKTFESVDSMDDGQEKSSLDEGAMEEIMDVLEFASLRKKQRKEDQDRAKQIAKNKKLEEAEQLRMRNEREEEELQRWDTEMKERNSARLAEEMAMNKELEAKMLLVNEQLAAEEEKQSQALEADKAVKRAETQAKRLKMAQDRKEREAMAAREAEKQVYILRELEEKAKRDEIKELIKMRKEDNRSRFSAEYAMEVEINELTKQLAKIKHEELNKFRKEESIRDQNDQYARERAERVEIRRKKADELLRRIEDDELTLSGLQDGGYEIPTDTTNNVGTLIDSSHRLMKDLLECRQKTVEALKRQFMVQEKTELFRKHYATVENEERRLRRAIRLIEINPAVIGNQMNVGSELGELQSALNAKQEALLELSTLAKEKEDQLVAANRSAQLLKIATNERDKLMNDRLKGLQDLQVNLELKLKNMKMNKENLTIEKDKLRLQVLQIQKRADLLRNELNRVGKHRGQLIDTDVWVEGVLQRCQTDVLKTYLTDELKLIEKKLEGMMTSLQDIRNQVFETTDKISKIKRDVDKVSAVTRVFFKNYKNFSKVSVQQLMSNGNEMQLKADKLEKRKLRETDIDQMLSNKSGPTTMVDKVRAKDSDIRNRDEKQFIGIDLILNPNEYLKISATEVEQMSFDTDYHCQLSKNDLDRIMKLPEQVNLALPFLNTAAEVNVHRLINKFLRGYDEHFFMDRDASSGDNDPLLNGMNTPGTMETASLHTHKHKSKENSLVDQVEMMRDAEVIHDILVREILRDRIRSTARTAMHHEATAELGIDEGLSAEEAQWRQLDMILSPHVYDIVELDLLDHQRKEYDRNKSINKKLNTLYVQSVPVPTKDPVKQSALQTKRKGTRAKKFTQGKDGDVYEEVRSHFEAGNAADMFDDQWYCPFSREELLAIRRKKADEVTDPNEVLIRNLMDKYYVDDNESTLGHHRINLLNDSIQRVSRIVQDADRRAIEEEKQLVLMRSASLDTYEQELQKYQKSNDNKSIKSVGSLKSQGIDVSGSVDTPRSMASTVSLESQVKTDKNDEEIIKRIWGSWEQVHPASAGRESQQHYFRVFAFDSSRDHPAAMAVHEDVGDEFNESDEEEEDTSEAGLKNESDLHHFGLKALTSLDSAAGSTIAKRNRLNRRRGAFDANNSLYVITNSIAELALIEARRVRGKIVLILSKKPMILSEVKDAVLQPRQSRSHYFTIPDKESIRVLDITVSIVFQGEFGLKGYKLGRLAAGMFRLVETKTQTSNTATDENEEIVADRHKVDGSVFKTSVPVAIGYAPYPLQSPNLPDSIGRIIIVHRPKVKPLKPGNFQLVIGAASGTKYSIEVSCSYAKTALPIIDEAITTAKTMQSRLPIILTELESLLESLKLAERKLIICEKMIKEAEVESERCQNGMQHITRLFEIDDEELNMLEEERRNYKRELSILEIEYSQWAHTYATRHREKDDIKEGIRMMHEYHRKKVKEKETIKHSLEEARRDLPACIGLLRNLTEAANVAAALNTTIHGISAAAGAAATGDYGGIKLSTPAEDVRRQMRQFGFESLLLEEQQWCILDQSINPSKYEWLREAEEKENAERETQGKKPKKIKYNAAVEAYRMKKVEIEHILATPFNMLSRREVIVRKLLTKYHDDKEFVKKALSAAAYSFDPHLAERVRVKKEDQHSKEEREWSSIDRILHPEVWKYYVNEQNKIFDNNSKSAVLPDDAPSEKKKKQRPKSDPSPPPDNKGGGALGAIGNKVFSLFSRATSPDKSSTPDQMKSKGSEKTRSKGGKDDRTKSPDKQKGRTSSKSPSKKQKPLNSDPSVRRNDQTALGDSDKETGEAAVRPTESTRPPRSRPTTSQSSQIWKCPFNREKILQIWRTPRHLLQSEDERTVFRLLQKYNGSYSSYMEVVEDAKKRNSNAKKVGSHIQWEKTGGLISKDVDFRARQIFREIDRATYTQNEWIHSDVLHANDQKFPTKVLRVHLEQTLDTLLEEQIRDRERAEMFRVESSDDDSVEDNLGTKGKDEGKNGEEIDEEVDEEDEEGGEKGQESIMSKVRKRAEKRLKRNKKLKQKTMEQEVMVAKKVINTKGKSGNELAEAILQNQLGMEGCLACRSAKCRWASTVDVTACLDRKNVIDQEIERVRLDRDSVVFESDIALSAQLGGNRIFKRADLMDELMSETRELERRIDLNNVDKELHDAFCCRKEFFESKHLHGYSILLWTNNARKALQARQNRLVALAVSKEVVDDILDWMLEGWYFGERESQFHAMGYVPTVKKDGRVRPGQDQINTVVTVVAKMKKRAENRRKGIITSESKKGVMLEKAWEIEMNSQMTLTKLKVARDGNSHEHLLNETESTLRFGLFLLTLMYFRAMTFVKREQRSWSQADDEIGVKQKGKEVRVMTDERLRMVDEEAKILARKKKIEVVLARSRVGEQRRVEREAAERKEAKLKLHAIVRRQRLEMESICRIQKVFRGHIGRKAAKRWALKRAELGSMNALLTATAVCIQRFWRGYLARSFALVKRMEMAQFIALMRVQEAQTDEELYWQTHPWARFKKTQREWIQEKIANYRGGQALGAARLTAAEQEELEGRTMDSIKRQIEETGDDDEESEEEEEEEEDEDEVNELNRVASKSASNREAVVPKANSRSSRFGSTSNRSNR